MNPFFRGFIAGLIAVVLLGFVATAHAADTVDIVEVITLSGEINDDTVTTVTKQVKEFNANDRVKAVLLVVDSPGGGAIQSSDLYEELSKLTVPVVGWCHDICASGGVYALMATSVKYIGVRMSTIIGSVGVIATVKRDPDARVEVYKSGKFKDAHNILHAPDAETRAYLQGINDYLASLFYGVVARGRGHKISLDGWVEIKSAKIFVGAQGVTVGLADAVMSREAAIAKAKALSGSSAIFTRDELPKDVPASAPLIATPPGTPE
jgi:signal peptide peptidase SppA